MHLQLNPSNILVNKEGKIKIINYGIAQLQDSIDPIFNADEYYQPISTKFCFSKECDYFSLGTLLFELLCKGYSQVASWKECDQYMKREGINQENVKTYKKLIR
mmetsp:Transcript_26294/g.23171  ORF Transcript_26294/g.23171 Transcript_26294/m.23171 type:complete len:104 (-) Transcript_26294:20-331(-)